MDSFGGLTARVVRGFCHDICLHLISAAGTVSGLQRPFTAAEY